MLYKKDDLHFASEPATLSDIKQAAKAFDCVLVTDRLDGMLARVRNCLEQGNDGDALNRLCQLQDMIDAAQEET